MNWHPTHRYDVRFKEELDAMLPGLSDDLGRAVELDALAANRLVANILGMACQSQNVRNIILGREAATELPREWLLERIERIAEQTFDFMNDDYEYRRLLEVAELLDPNLFACLVRRGLASQKPDIVEAANDFESRKSD